MLRRGATRPDHGTNQTAELDRLQVRVVESQPPDPAGLDAGPKEVADRLVQHRGLTDLPGTQDHLKAPEVFLQEPSP